MIHLTPFTGIYSNANPHSIPAGAAQSQVNMQCIAPGQLDCRGGNRPVSFANSTTAVTSDVVGMSRMEHPAGQVVIYVLADGKVKAGRTPS